MGFQVLERAMLVRYLISCIAKFYATFYLSGAADPGNFMMMMIGWMIMAAMMYFMRPQSMRNNSLEGKPQGV